MLEEVIEKLKKKAMILYDGQPEAVRDFETLSHYFVYIWKSEDLEDEFMYRQTKAMVIDMWFEGKFNFKEKITMDDLAKSKQELEGDDDECENCKNEKYVPPPPPEHKYIC
jgi:hypothetical protein